ncbi:type I glyceraldehyde-3-phosphate dehydrogenase, partial [Candidatus Woesearchaeota archaeon]|nr:type I glyceraldehyde-3-phosphate dehydrogenase [Candidatus Woesearchaeota archaeon]
MVRVAINGFGRIGRQVLQAGIDDPEIEWVAVNDLTDTKTLAYLLRYDSTQKLPNVKTIEAKEHSIVVNGKEIKVVSELDPEKLPWKELNVDVVIESTGLFTKKADALKHINAGAKKVLISAPSKDCDITLVKGVNEARYNGEQVVSNASCTTNCLAPMAKVLQDNFGIEHAFMTTCHAYTADQRIQDTFHKKDPRRGRAGAINIIPTSTGAAKAVAEVIPELKGKMDGIALRVPIPTGSITDFVAILKKNTTVEEVNALFKSVAANELKGIISYSEDPIVSADIVHDPHSCIFDPALTRVIDGSLVKVFGWYDNEWGYS